MRGWWVGCLLLGGCIFGGKVDAESWPDKAAKATCDFSRSCAAAGFYATYGDTETCRATNEADLVEELTGAVDAGCLFDEDMAKACLDALDSSCRTAGEEQKTIFEPCTMVWNCDGAEPSPTTDSY